MSHQLYVDRAVALGFINGAGMTTAQRADEVVRGLYGSLPDSFLADMLQAGKRDYDQSMPAVRLVNDAIARELERRAQGAA